jgi:hypothetical protein
MTRDEQINAGRLKMREAFVRLSDLARRLGAAEDELSELHGQFFDGNEAINRALSR